MFSHRLSENRRYSAQGFASQQTGYRTGLHPCNVAIRVDAPGARSSVISLKRYPSPSLRSGPAEVRPLFLPARNVGTYPELSSCCIRLVLHHNGGSSCRSKLLLSSAHLAWPLAATPWVSVPSSARAPVPLRPRLSTQTWRRALWSARSRTRRIATSIQNAANQNLNSPANRRAINPKLAVRTLCPGGFFLSAPFRAGPRPQGDA